MRSLALLLLALALILAVTLTPDPGSRHLFEPRPFTDIWVAVSQPWHPLNALEAVGNVLLFAPLGAVLWLRRWPLRRAVLAGAALSVAVELAQLGIPGRSTATDDVILNTLGAALGWQLGARYLVRLTISKPAGCSASRAGRP